MKQCFTTNHSEKGDFTMKMKNTKIFIFTTILGLALTFTACGNTAAPDTGTQINPDSIRPSAADNAAAADSSSYIGEEKALQIALEHAGLAAADLTFSKVKLDFDDGKWTYDTEFYAGNQEYDYEIDAVTGDILSFDYDMENSMEAPLDTTATDTAIANDASSSGSAISEADAKAAALAQVPGADESHIRMYKDYDDGRTVYEGKIIYNNMEYEFEIDGTTGNFLEWDEESVFD